MEDSSKTVRLKDRNGDDDINLQQVLYTEAVQHGGQDLASQHLDRMLKIAKRMTYRMLNPRDEAIPILGLFADPREKVYLAKNVRLHRLTRPWTP